MSPRAGFVLLDQIAPQLRAAIPAAVRPVGAEDVEELLQEAMVLAAQMLHALEMRGKEVTAGNICYYVTLLMKSGRRSQSGGRTDVLGSATMLDGKSLALSLEEPVGLNPETGETVVLGEMLAGSHEDPASTAARYLDWAEFLNDHDERYIALVRCAVSEQPTNSLKSKWRVSDSTLSTFKRNLAADIRETMGADVLEAICRRPCWQADVEGGDKNGCVAAMSGGSVCVEPLYDVREKTRTQVSVFSFTYVICNARNNFHRDASI